MPLFAEDSGSSWQKGASELPLVTMDGTQLRWGANDEHDGIILTAIEGSNFLTPSSIGSIAIPLRLVEEADPSLPAAAQQLIATADAAGVEMPALTLERHALTGPRLRGDRVLVTSRGVLSQVKADSAQRGEDILAISQATQALADVLPSSDLSSHARLALSDLLSKLDQPDSDPVSDEANPAYARRVIADHFLPRFLPSLGAPNNTLTDAVIQGTKLLPYERYEGPDGSSITRYADAWGEGSQVWQHPQGTHYAAPAPLPMYHWPLQRTDGFQQATVVIDLGAGADPINQPDFDQIDGARLYHQGRLLASWNKSDGFDADLDVWRSVVVADGPRLDDDIVDNYMPPHIVVSDGRGHIHHIISEHGVLQPPADGSRAEAIRFMDQAAVTLPDAAHLDLISQYLFKYVYDSPDPTIPLLLGNREVKSDIHQTAFETLSTTVGGVCRGDCDDLSELVEHIVDRQGKLSHVISLPGHAALAWAEEFNEQWHVFVLQTGPTLQFSAPRLQDALRATYQSFDASESFDPNAIGLLLRFSGENTRSPWRLSYRIFSDREYAETMIDVQKDWHYQTYLQGINKMLALIADGDEDTANYREMSGLYSFTGQYDKAVKYHRMAMERTDEPESVLLMAIELLIHLDGAERSDELAAVATDILDVQIPALRDELGQSMLQVGLQLAGSLGRYDQSELAARALRDTIGTTLGQAAQNIARWSQNNFNAEAWMHNPQLRMLDRILSWHSRVLIPLIEANAEGAITAAVPEFNHFLQVDEIYRRYIAFNGSDGGEIAQSYALQGRHLQARWGRETLLTRLAESELPLEPINHRERRIESDLLTARDLQWIKASVPFWSNLVLESLENIREEALTPEQAQAILPQLEAAIAAAEALKVNDPRTDYQAHYAKLIIAMISQDQDALHERLSHVARQKDKRLTDNTAMYMGDVAYALDSEWFTTAVEMWRDIVDHKPKYLWIAWRAALNHAPDKALIAARISAERFKDDQAFVDEYEFMQELLKP